MQKNLTIDDIEEISQAGATASLLPTPFDLKLITKKIPLKYCEYKISNLAHKMLTTESIAISNKGVLFLSLSELKKGTLLRIWIEIPDFWSRKSKIVEYRHTDAPTHFQVLSRVLSAEEILKRGTKYQILTEILSLDAVDENVLNEYLGNSGAINK
ncbi:hypothetical protein [Silvanigrella aquatica]|uniref:PilZ domain-containing protein n=1 Tax=Silvanigrella aquatica TaxID=1915309 RepID=A0A1L4CXR1_9BACT|nr:hypothetical protein [Silvanigrella aquatica]APJ02724.1 hypothetical protein AXG55_01795 [Silvanigrella aquatica]